LPQVSPQPWLPPFSLDASSFQKITVVYNPQTKAVNKTPTLARSQFFSYRSQVSKNLHKSIFSKLEIQRFRIFVFSEAIEEDKAIGFCVWTRKSKTFIYLLSSFSRQKLPYRL
jgi:hypothetical protein